MQIRLDHMIERSARKKNNQKVHKTIQRINKENPRKNLRKPRTDYKTIYKKLSSRYRPKRLGYLRNVYIRKNDNLNKMIFKIKRE